MEYVKGQSRGQVTLLPDCLDDYVSTDNPVRIIDAFVERLELKELGFVHATLNQTGRPPYNPKDLLRLYIYGYFFRIRSSRQLMREARRNVEVMWLLRQISPDFRSICLFRSRNRRVMPRVFRQFTKVMTRLGLFGKEEVAIDGSKFKASNSKYRSYSRKQAEKALKKIDDSIRKYLKELDQNDRSEEHEPKSDEVDDLETRLKQLDEEMSSEQKDLDPPTQKSNPSKEPSPRKALVRLKKKRADMLKIQAKIEEADPKQVCLTDSEARRMRAPEGFVVGYNAQIAVDAQHNLIAHIDVNQRCNDNRQLSNMAIETKKALGADSLSAIADRGYFSNHEIKACFDEKITALVPMSEQSRNKKKGMYTKKDFVYDAESNTYRCPANQTLAFLFQAKDKRLFYGNRQACSACLLKAKCTTAKARHIVRWEHESVIDEMREKLRQRPNVMKERGSMVEHPFGFLKQVCGMRQFLSRGLDNARAEFSLGALVFNMKRTMNILEKQGQLSRMIEAIG